MSEEARDVIVVGGGPAGYVAAIRAAQLGRKVTLVEREALGGVCLNWGCIPTKALLSSAALLREIKNASQFGIEVKGVTVDYPRIVERSRETAAALRKGVEFLMRKNRIEVVNGRAELGEGKRLTIHAQELKHYSFNDVIIAAGSRPRTLPQVEVDGEVIHTSRTILDCRRLPQKILIVGAGAIGVEFACFFHGLGAQVALVEMCERIMPLEDAEAAGELQHSFSERGIIIKTSTQVEQLKRVGKTVTAVLRSGSEEEKWSGDSCLLAVGTAPNTEGLGCEAAGIALNAAGFIEIDSRMQTNVQHHFAAGDITGPPMLAHKATHEGLAAAAAACGAPHVRLDYGNIPSCAYCRPQIASVGKTEQRLRQEGVSYAVGKIPFTAVGKAQAAGETEGFVKILSAPDTGELLGVHIVHAQATELIAEAAVVRSHEGIAATLVETIHPHPTLSEALAEAAAAAMKRPINF